MSQFITDATTKIGTFLADIGTPIAGSITILVAFVGLWAVIRFFTRGVKSNA